MKNASLANSGQLDSVLASYAAGNLPRPLSALVSAHLEISLRNREYVALLEETASDRLSSAKPAPLSARSAMLERIFVEGVEPQNSSLPVDTAVLPRSLRDFLECDLKDVPWRTVLPGVKEFRLGKGQEQEATLYWIRAGKQMPSHTHDGSEVTLVLQGGFKDVTGHYKRGDVAVADADLDHHPVADNDIDCICFAVTDAPLRLTGPIGRIFQRFFGH
jgi:putative transcriptional regulator